MPSEFRIRHGQVRLLLLAIRPARPTLAEVPLADLSFHTLAKVPLTVLSLSRGVNGYGFSGGLHVCS